MEKKVLLFSCFNDFSALNLALEFIEKGADVHFLQCDCFMGICQHNRYGNFLLCNHCKNAMRRNIERLGINTHAKVFYLSDIIKEEDLDESTLFKIDFNSIRELKSLEYHSASVGYGAFSSYVTFSRNVMPDINDKLKLYISYLIRKEIAVYHALERLDAEQHYTMITLHNARFAQFKPFYEYARLNQKEYICTEHDRRDGVLLNCNFINDIPHSIEYIARNVLNNWEIGDKNTRETIGRSFFEKRVKGIEAGDKVYTKNQHVGKLPDNWDEDVENIVIFNSSEDEYCAISREYDKQSLFENQYVALYNIFRHYADDNQKHFYLRIHPNLRNVPFKSHRALYGLKFDNVTIIGPDSSISSYALLKHSDKVIIFTSTMGPESSYWGKPVIALCKECYALLDFVYTPHNQEELWTLINTKDLPSKMNENVIKYGYYLLHPNNQEITRVPYDYVKFKFMGREFENYSIMTLLGSCKLDTLFERWMNKFRLLSKFKKLPCTDPYQVYD